MKSNRPVIALTMGDPAGIGPELCLRALIDPVVLEQSIPVVFADAAILTRVGEACGLTAAAHVIGADDWQAERTGLDAPAVVDCSVGYDAFVVEPGKVSAECGRASYAFIESATEAAISNQVAAITTAPINKEALHLAGVQHAGHTEILAEKTGAKRTCMMFVSEELTVSLASIHVGLAEVKQALTTDRIQDTIELTADAVQGLLGRSPRIDVCGLNPHAGENGLFGDGEEEEVIAPAIARAAAKGINVSGPIPADTAFLPERRQNSDAIVCMYHDQALIPLKMLAFDHAVNVTLGLPIVRTSVDHGTAFDIAWTGKADPGSLVQAILLAVRLAD